jgi:hypothetical protein
MNEETGNQGMRRTQDLATEKYGQPSLSVTKLLPQPSDGSVRLARCFSRMHAVSSDVLHASQP